MSLFDATRTHEILKRYQHKISSPMMFDILLLLLRQRRAAKRPTFCLSSP
jgi:hypothetical protein